MPGKMKLTVGGITYVIRGDGSDDYLNELGSALELKLKTITKSNPNLSTTMAAILAALEFCDEAKKAKQEIAHLQDELSYALATPHQLRIGES